MCSSKCGAESADLIGLLVDVYDRTSAPTRSTALRCARNRSTASEASTTPQIMTRCDRGYTQRILRGLRGRHRCEGLREDRFDYCHDVAMVGRFNVRSGDGDEDWTVWDNAANGHRGSCPSRPRTSWPPTWSCSTTCTGHARRTTSAASIRPSPSSKPGSKSVGSTPGCSNKGPGSAVSADPEAESRGSRRPSSAEQSSSDG